MRVPAPGVTGLALTALLAAGAAAGVAAGLRHHFFRAAVLAALSLTGLGLRARGRRRRRTPGGRVRAVPGGRAPALAESVADHLAGQLADIRAEQRRLAQQQAEMERRQRTVRITLATICDEADLDVPEGLKPAGEVATIPRTPSLRCLEGGRGERSASLQDRAA